VALKGNVGSQCCRRADAISELPVTTVPSRLVVAERAADLPGVKRFNCLRIDSLFLVTTSGGRLRCSSCNSCVDPKALSRASCHAKKRTPVRRSTSEAFLPVWALRASPSRGLAAKGSESPPPLAIDPPQGLRSF
jgi:hypothetical protein